MEIIKKIKKYIDDDNKGIEIERLPPVIRQAAQVISVVGRHALPQAGGYKDNPRKPMPNIGRRV